MNNQKKAILGTIGFLFSTTLMARKYRLEAIKERKILTDDIPSLNHKTIMSSVIRHLGPKSRLSNQKKRRKLMRQVPQLRKSKKFK